MNRIPAALLLFLFLAISVFAQEKPTMGVLEAKLVGKDVDVELRPLFTTAVRSRIVKLVKERVDVIEGSKLDRMIQVNAAQCATSSCLAKFARQVGIDYIMEIQMISHKGTWTAILKLASAKSESLLGEESSTFANEVEAQKGLPTLAEQLVASVSLLSGTPTTGAVASSAAVKLASTPAGGHLRGDMALDGALGTIKEGQTASATVHFESLDSAASARSELSASPVATIPDQIPEAVYQTREPKFSLGGTKKILEGKVMERAEDPEHPAAALGGVGVAPDKTSRSGGQW